MNPQLQIEVSVWKKTCGKLRSEVSIKFEIELMRRAIAERIMTLIVDEGALAVLFEKKGETVVSMSSDKDPEEIWKTEILPLYDLLAQDPSTTILKSTSDHLQFCCAINWSDVPSLLSGLAVPN